ncbi:ribosomal RNA processing protein 36 homolog isoform X2 [Rhea pennata]|uniref:ribosomal RNA processing protein 36 homolog isoform X2 n=1 Tax=Rhea pennata TaxID=8795 RepID=UPI002E2768C6
MTIFCSHCHRPLQAETSCPPGRARQAPSVSKPFRSTKGASKARRDQINVELQALRSLLPISSQEKERLSYLNTMALVCLRLRGAHLFPPGSCGAAAHSPLPQQLLSMRGTVPAPVGASASNRASPADSAPPAGPAFGVELLSLLPGFFLVFLANGKLAYVSENVAQVLGLSTGDTIFDMLDGTAREAVQEKLLLAQEQPGTEVTFVSEMRTSRAFRLQHGGNRAVAVRGRLVALHRPASPPASAFVAFCTPVAQLPADGDTTSQDDVFHSVHALDMTFTDVTESVIYHLGYRREELIGRSWYSLLHPDDTHLAAAQHRAVDLSHISFEELLQMQNGMGTRAYRMTGGKKTANPTKPKIKQQQSKKGPLEMSAKKPVPFLRQVVPVKKKVQRDPRFDDLSGEYNPEIFLKTYSFLDSIKKREKEMIQKQLKKCQNEEQKEKLQQLLKRMTQQEEEQKKKQKWRERELSLKRQQRELAQQGKKPFYLKKSEKRKLELAEKYAELRRSGKLESFLNKRRKRNAIKDKRRLPSQKSL